MFALLRSWHFDAICYARLKEERRHTTKAQEHQAYKAQCQAYERNHEEGRLAYKRRCEQEQAYRLYMKQTMTISSCHYSQEEFIVPLFNLHIFYVWHYLFLTNL
jgi:hypothetical protein